MPLPTAAPAVRHLTLISKPHAAGNDKQDIGNRADLNTPHAFAGELPEETREDYEQAIALVRCIVDQKPTLA